MARSRRACSGIGMPVVMLIPPLSSPDHPIRASAPTMYVATAPHGASPEEHRDMAELVSDATASIHTDGSPHSWVVLPHGWVAMGGTKAAAPPALVRRLAAAQPGGWSLDVLRDA